MQHILLVLILFLASGCCERISPWKLPICGNCPYKGQLRGFVLRDENNGTCKCTHPVEFCLETAKECPVRQTCEMKPIRNCLFKQKNKKREVCPILSAKCINFEECPEFKCNKECKKSGFLVDKNNCERCYCKDMCKEIGCSKENCTIRNVPGEHPIVRCGKKLK